MICVSLGIPSVSECLKALEFLDFAEVRLDLMQVSLSDIPSLVSGGKRLIGTCRPGANSPETRKSLLLECIRCGMDMVDVEWDAEEEFKVSILQEAKIRGCRVILSYHNFQNTPSRAELESLIARCFESGADYVKVACQANSLADSAQLLGLLDNPFYQKKLIVVGMGKAGQAVRVLAPFLGSPFTYASFDTGLETAPGQFSQATLSRLFEQIQKLFKES